MLFAYGGTDPLPTLGTFSVTVVSPSSVGDGRTPLGRETAEMLGLLHIGPFHSKSVASEHSEDDIRRRYHDLFTVMSSSSMWMSP